MALHHLAVGVELLVNGRKRVQCYCSGDWQARRGLAPDKRINYGPHQCFAECGAGGQTVLDFQSTQLKGQVSSAKRARAYQVWADSRMSQTHSLV